MLFGLLFWTSPGSDIGHRAGDLSLMNMAFPFVTPHLILSDILGVSLRTCRKIHCSMAWMSVLLLTIHRQYGCSERR